MQMQIIVPKKFKSYVPDLDNHVQIENSAGGVVMSATRDNFSNNRKMFFIRQLSAKDHILDRYKCSLNRHGMDFLG
jgi:hypothetical protein